MITWVTGRSGSGKTTLAKKIIANDGGILLDGDDMREVWGDLGLSKEDRFENGLRIARLAKTLDAQGHNVVVAGICGYRELRRQVRNITNCRFVQLLDVGKEPVDEYDYEF